ncbi:MAG TPA: hypothetical protein VLG37_01540 [Candidatus Saccharimonadales bacterium]|nr:hypothetical protein [Candidatus Saccharimonadales bacterium]
MASPADIAHVYSIETLPPAVLRSDVVDAHDFYHRQDSRSRLPLIMSKLLCRALTTSPDPDHQLDGGWQAVLIATQTDGPVRSTYFDIAREAWQGVEATEGDSFMGIRAGINLAFLPSFGEKVASGSVNVGALTSRLRQVHSRLLSSYARVAVSKRSELIGVANELLVLSLLLRHAEKSGLTDLIAWPVYSWQDDNYRVTPRFSRLMNFDVAYGSFPNVSRPIQVKSSLHVPRDKNFSSFRKGSGEPTREEVYDFWRNRYMARIALIFGDEHLDNDGSLRTNRLFLEGGKKAKPTLTTFTDNILREISYVDQKAASEPDDIQDVDPAHEETPRLGRRLLSRLSSLIRLGHSD